MLTILGNFYYLCKVLCTMLCCAQSYLVLNKIQYNNMERFKCKNIFLLLLLSLMAVTSCTSYKKVPYLQNSGDFDPMSAVELHEARIMPQDLLNITIVNRLPTAPFKPYCF